MRASIQWKNQDPTLVKGLILSADTELKFYWLQIYQFGTLFEASIYGITAEGRFDLMGRELCRSADEAKQHAQSQWESFKTNSRLYKTAAKRGAK